MIYDILDIFKEKYSERGDKLILDSYELKEGLYVKINENEKIGYFTVKKKNRESFFTDIFRNLNHNAYQWFKERDYYSGYLNSNKAFFDKKIHNINYFSLFVKIDSFLSEDKKIIVKERLENITNEEFIKISFNKELPNSLINKQYLQEIIGEEKTKYLFEKEEVFKKLLTQEILGNHFLNLCSYKKFTKLKEKEVLKSFEKYLSDRERKKNILKKYKFVKNNLDSILKVAQENHVKNYIKIFFDEPIEKYKKESEIYYSLKIFNDINYNENIGNEIFGLSNSNMGLNSKKPFLEHKTKLKTIPFLIENNNALLLKKFFDWLKVQPYKDEYNKPIDKYLDNKFFIKKHSANDESEIMDFDYIPCEIDKLNTSITIKNYLWLKSTNVLLENYEIEFLNQLEEKVDDIFYNHQLTTNYYGEVWKKLDNSFANFIYITRDAMISYFRKYDDKNFYQVVKKYGSKFVVEHVKKDRLFKAGLALNLKFSLLEYKGEEIMDIKTMQKNILDNLLDSNYKDLETEEFFYLCGQVARYLINQSKQGDKTGSLLEPFLKIKDPQRLKEIIKTTYFKYKHAINLHFLKFNNAMSLIMAFDKEENLSVSSNMDSFLIGALSDNIFYMKKEE